MDGNKQIAILFRTSEITKRKFESTIKLLGKNNKEILEGFMLKFIENPTDSLKFIEH